MLVTHAVAHVVIRPAFDGRLVLSDCKRARGTSEPIGGLALCVACLHRESDDAMHNAFAQLVLRTRGTRERHAEASPFSCLFFYVTQQ